MAITLAAAVTATWKYDDIELEIEVEADAPSAAVDTFRRILGELEGIDPENPFTLNKDD